MNIKRLLFVLVGILLLSGVSYSQVDSTSLEEEYEDSIVLIKEDPVILKKTIHHEEEVYSPWLLDLYASRFWYDDKHCNCDVIGDFKSALRKYTNSKRGNSIGVSILYTPKKKSLLYKLGIDYYQYLENFTYFDSTSNHGEIRNRYSYGELSLGFGYWMRRRRSFSVMPMIEAVLSKKIQNKGYTFDYSDTSKVYKIEDVNREANLLFSGKLSVKFIFLNNRRTKIYFEPYSKVNFTSLIEYSKFYYLRRWSNGITVGILFAL